MCTCLLFSLSIKILRSLFNSQLVPLLALNPTGVVSGVYNNRWNLPRQTLFRPKLYNKVFPLKQGIKGLQQGEPFKPLQAASHNKIKNWKTENINIYRAFNLKIGKQRI